MKLLVDSKVLYFPLFSRFARSTLVKATSLDNETSRKPLDKKIPPRAATPARQEESESDEEDDDDNENYETAKEPPKPVMSSFFTRQRRLPDPEPRLLEMHESDSEEESESEEESDEDEEEEEEEENAKSKTTPSVPQTTATSTAAGRSSQEEDEEEEEDDEDEDEEESENSSSSSSENESAESSDQAFKSATDVNSKKQSSSDSNEPSNSRKDASNHYNEDSDDQEESSQKPSEDDDDEFPSKNSESTIKQNQPADRGRKSSDDTDATDSSSGSSSASSSTNYHSLSRNTTPHVSPNGLEDRMSSEGSGYDSGTGRFRNRPFLARSKSSHEIGLGYDNNLDLDDDEEEEEPTTPTYKSRPDRKSEELSRTRQSSFDTVNSSNSCWANYLKNKYGSNAAGRVVPRSRSSHSLYQRSDEETSEDEVPSGRDPVLSSTYSFSNPRSTYLQKRRMMLKLGARGTDSGNFTWPRGVAVGTDNSIIVADSSNHRIQVIQVIKLLTFKKIYLIKLVI